MAIPPVSENKRKYDEFNPADQDPAEEEIINELVFEAFQHHLFGNETLKSKALDRAKVLNRTHPLITQFHRLQLDLTNNRIIIQ